jgi:hypothetical protein
MKRLSMLVLVGCLFLSGCATVSPPAGTYTPAVTQTYQADQLIKDLAAIGQTARNLNATTGAEHLSDLNTSRIRDFSLIAGAGVNAWGNGATTLAAAAAGLDSAALPTGVLSVARAAFVRAIAAHGAGASALYIVIDVYQSLRRPPPEGITIDAVKNPTLLAVLNAIDADIAALPVH